MKEKHIFIDEAGDLTLFDKRKHPVRLGENGVSRYFTLGAIQIKNPKQLSLKLEELRADILADPSLKNIPSLEKTKAFFHAKDDHFSIRREVFNLIAKEDFMFFFCFFDKADLQQKAKIALNQHGHKITEKEIYHALAEALIVGALRGNDETHFYFAKRGKTITTNTLKQMLEVSALKAQNIFGINNQNYKFHITSPKHQQGLQVVDYCLWAVQRFLERKETYYLEKIRDRIIMMADMSNNKIFDIDNVSTFIKDEFYKK